MARDTTDMTPVASFDDLVGHLKGGEKPPADFRIGTEHEKFGYYPGDLSPVPYEGERGIRKLLEGMQAISGWEPIVDDGKLIGLAGGEGEGAISLEPGGQFELSGAPLETIHDTCRESNRHLADVRKVASELGIEFLGLGSSPLWTLAETPRMPKSRYAIMERYMPKVGTRGLDMMFRTTTIQVNLDFSSEADMRTKMQVGMRLQPLASALFANSPFTEGTPNGLVSWRSDVWSDVDNRRSGLLPFVFEPGFTYADYATWALDVPMYFVMREGRYHDATHVTFRQFLDGALKGEIADPEPSMGDWTNHLSTLFPDVRLKRFLEMRGADGGPWRGICALPAFWVGLLYDEAALADAASLTADWSFEEVAALRAEVPRSGLRTPFRGGTMLDVARAVLDISRRGLVSRKRLNEDGFDESIFLGPLEDIVGRGTTSAEELVRRYEGEWDGSMDRLFRHLTY
ncbi:MULTISPECIES: glutamate--cysteine ligase [unclassified Aureimonas]|uniref:glutamate--cysteine ligase n=1 Tax=unclassified Aureimonas TaxID=2615206 RepID=UPI0006FE0636|nr:MULTISPECIES: glutamate--cysteine ligase [unclassified Aureimonas]KQT69769.1 glutamate--cysteine ligase [Aureimonas sp. Leaf427]KQT76079.1 glutamate--cysteine ligase [Aureimonas sp. Leaf460]